MKKILLLAICVCLTNNLFAEDEAWDRIELDQNVQTTAIASIMKYEGKLYISTSTSGVYIYDGENWEYITNALNYPGIDLKSKVNNIVRSEDGYFYAAFGFGGGGLLKFKNPDEAYFYDPSNSEVPSDELYDISADSKGNVWFISNSKYLTKYDGENFDLFDTYEDYQLPPRPAGTIIVDNVDLVYYNTFYSVVRYVNNQLFNLDSTNTPLSPGAQIQGVGFTRSNIFWIRATKDYAMKLYRLPNKVGEEWVEYNTDNSIFSGSEYATNIVEDSKGNTFFSIQESDSQKSIFKLYVLDNEGEWSQIDIPESVMPNGFTQPISMYIDTDNILYLGTIQDGIITVDLTKLLITGVDGSIPLTNLPNIWIDGIKPNPVTSQAEVKFFCIPGLLPDLQIKLYDMLGNELADYSNLNRNYNNSTARGYIEIIIPSGYSSGSYLINFDSGGESRSGKIIIK